MGILTLVVEVVKQCSIPGRDLNSTLLGLSLGMSDHQQEYQSATVVYGT
jgi:hypothetical protein